MFYLILAVLIQCMLSIILKIANIRKYDSNSITFINYTVAMIMAVGSAVTKGQYHIFSELGNMNPASLMTEKTLGNTAFTVILLGIISGVIFLVNLLILNNSVARNGAGISSFFKQSGFIGGVLLAVIFFKETLKPLQMVGIVLVVVALLLLVGDFKSLDVKAPVLLFLMLLNGTIIEVDNKFFNDFAITEYKPLFLAAIFLVAFVCCVIYIVYLVKKENKKLRFGTSELIAGVLLGLSNMLNNLFQLKSLDSLDASVVFPSLAGGSLFIMTLASIVVFKEKTTVKHILSVVIAIMGLVFINM